MNRKTMSTSTKRVKSKTAQMRELRGYAYLTSAKFVVEAQKAGAEAAQKTLENIGYIVVSLDGWVVKKHRDGRIERLEKI